MSKGLTAFLCFGALSVALAGSSCLFDYAGAERCANGTGGACPDATSISASTSTETATSSTGSAMACTALSHGRCALGQPCTDPSDCDEAKCLDGFCTPPVFTKRWLDLKPPSLPNPPTYGASMVMMGGTAAPGIRLFGGFGGQPTLAQDHTWIFNGSDWGTAGISGPAARGYAAMAYDPNTTRSLLVGGIASSALDDVWMLGVDTGWTQPPNATLPQKIHRASMVYDSHRMKFVLFGGWDASDLPLNDLYERDGETGAWAKVTPVVPAGQTLKRRFLSAMVYDLQAKRIVYFGGKAQVSSGDPSNADAEMWAYDPSPAPGKWTVIDTTQSSPEKRFGHVMAYDTDRNCMVLYGGAAGPSTSERDYTETWEFVGGQWTLVSAANPNGPGGSLYGSMVYDSSRKRMVLFGGCATASCAGGTLTGTFAYVELGQPCGPGRDCLNGQCVNSICCDAPSMKCPGKDEVCNAKSNPGVCTDPADAGM